MKLTVLFLTAAFLNVSAKSFSQNISFTGNNVPIEKVFVECKKQTGYSFLYPSTLLSIANPVSIHAENVPLEQFLKELFKNQPIGYEINNRSILLYQKLNVTPKINPVNIENTGIDHAAFNTFPVKIKVVDSLGRPMVRASVLVRNKKISKVTDADGQADLSVSIGDVLEISFVGFETMTHTIKDRSQVIYIWMKLSDKGMDEVVTGYTKLRKESFTGNSIRVTQEELLRVGSRNVIGALQVFDPSFRMEVNNLMGSNPNALPEFYIRGRSGIGVKSLDQVDVSEATLANNPNLPIFIMDNYEVPVERVYDFDITRIASVTILKDAAATAIYGSRAANGVVVIQTVPPKPGKLLIDYNVVTSLSAPDLSDYNLMNAAEKIRAEELAGFYNLTGNGRLDAQTTQELLAKKNQLTRGVNTDWIAQPLQNAFNQKHTLVFDAGFEQLRFNALLKYDKEKGVMKGSERERKGAGLVIDYRFRNIQIRNDLNFDVVKSQESPYGNFADYTTKNPYDEIYDEFGKPVKLLKEWRFGTPNYNLVNPMYEALMTNNYSTNNYQTLNNNTSIVWRPISKMMVKGDISITQTNKRADNFTDPKSGTQNVLIDPNTQGRLMIRRTEEYALNTNLTVNYTNNIGGHNMNFNGGLNARETKATQISEFYLGFPSGFLNSPNYANAMERKSTYVDNISRLLGTFVALNYTYRDIYLLDLSGRLDGSSSFGTEKRFAPFWSVGAGVNLHNYDFLKSNTIFNRVKISGSFGQLGKTNFPPYAARGTFLVQPDRYITGSGVLLKAMENPLLTWEKTNTTDLILDMAMLKNRININVNWYNKVTNSLVNDVDMPLSSGFEIFKDNIGKIRNRGVDAKLSFEVYRTKDWYFSVYANFSTNRNTLVELSNSLKRYNEQVNQEYDGYDLVAQYIAPANKKKYSTAYTKYVEGGSVTSIFGMRSLGINPADGKEVFLRPDGTVTYAWLATDQVIIGDATPKGQGSFGFNVQYKEFTLSSSLMYQYGAQAYNYTLLDKVENVDLFTTNADRRVLSQRWQQPGDLTALKDIADRNMITRPTSRFIQNNNYVQLNSVSLAYEFDRRKIAKYGLTRFKLQLNSNNVAMISSIQQERGLQYPFARTFDFTIKAVF